MRDQKALFREGVKKLKLDLTKHQEEQLKKFLQSVLNENKKFNLTGITDPREAIIKHLFDSCLLYTSPSPRDGLLSRMPSSA